LFVNASGNIGVGTATPNAGITVKRTAVGNLINTDDGTIATFIADTTGSVLNYGTFTSHPVAFKTDNAERMRLTSAGLLGLGTSSPAAKLDVWPASSNDAAFRGNAGVSTQVPAFEFRGYNTNSTNGGLDIRTNLNSTFTDRVRITNDGLVGIGTSSPNTALDVNGTINVRTNNFQFGRITTNNVSADTGGLSFQYISAGSFATGITLDGGGKVGIGTTSPSTILDVNTSSGASQLRISNGTYIGYLGIDSAFAGIDYASQSGGHRFRVGASFTEAARIDSSGRLLVGTSSARGNFFNSTISALIQAEDVGDTTGSLALTRNSNTIYSSSFILAKSRGTSLGSNTIVQSGDRLGEITFQGNDGSQFVAGASILGEVDGTPGADDMPGRLVFSTTADGAASPTERMRLGSDGWFYVGTTSKTLYAATSSTTGLTFSPGELGVASSNSNAVYVNRTVSDGDLVGFFQDGTKEGTISVSGTTVSYNGAHLSRWSQLPGGTERTEILRGTVLSNIDEMCGWGEEDNEQLNRMKVSDVEGDKNVSGVFQAWDDDDDTYVDDFYCAMTGDFIIRIAEGVTVERGDLLMSAGDGTAKPQDDDIIRSKTIAKVTSTCVTCTYEDGSYCVPCVLMAC
jgi:hypothetical protein